MRLEPLISLWLLVPIVIACLAIFVRIMLQHRAKQKKISHSWIQRIAIVVLLILVALGPSVPGKWAGL